MQTPLGEAARPGARARAVVVFFLLVSVPAVGVAREAQRCRALDGDTVQCGAERVRLRDVYAAERGEPLAEAQRRALQRRLDRGRVRIVRHGTDPYGRTLGDVYVDGRRVTQLDVGARAGRGSDPSGAVRRPGKAKAAAHPPAARPFAQSAPPRPPGRAEAAAKGGRTGRSRSAAL